MIDQALTFHALPASVRERAIRRIIAESSHEFRHDQVARRYMDLDEAMLSRPLADQPLPPGLALPRKVAGIPLATVH